MQQEDVETRHLKQTYIKDIIACFQDMKSRARVNNTVLIDSVQCLIISNHTFKNTNVSLNDKISVMLQ